MAWIKNTIKDAVISSILESILKSNPQLYVAIDLLNEVTILEVIQHYRSERAKLELPPRKPVDWLHYIHLATKLPLTTVLVKLLVDEYGVNPVSGGMGVQELIDSFTKIGGDGK